MRLNASNNAESKLTQAISETDTVITVEDTSTFPELPFLLTIFDDDLSAEVEVNEIVKVTEVNGNELTVERGQEGTIAKGWEIGSKIENRFTAGMYDGLASEKVVIEHLDKIATKTELGHVKVDGETITIDAEGVISSIVGVSETTEPITYYVSTAGSDSNVGSEISPFETIQKALNSLPKLIRHNCTIYIEDGSYSESLSISSFIGDGDLFIEGLSKSDNSVFVNDISIVGNTCRVFIRYVSHSGINSPFVDGVNCTYLSLRDFRSTSNNNLGLRVNLMNYLNISNGTISNKNTAVALSINSNSVISLNGDNNNIGFAVSNLSRAFIQSSNNLTASTLISEQSGGTVIQG